MSAMRLYHFTTNFPSGKTFQFRLSNMSPTLPYLVLIFGVTVISLHLITITATTSNNGEEEEAKFDFREDAEERLRSHFALDHRKSLKLALVEQDIFLTLLAITTIPRGKTHTREDISLDDCSRSLKKYMKEFEKDSHSLGEKAGFPKAKAVAENPLLLYRMIRRIAVILVEGVMKACPQSQEDQDSDIHVVTAIKNVLTRTNATLPTTDDLNDALMGVLRIHFVYGFNAVTQLRLGIFRDVHTNVTLNFEDCIKLGRKALEKDAVVLAYQWFVSADMCLDEANDLTDVERKAADIQLQISWEDLLFKTDAKDLDDLDNLFKHETEEQLDVDWWPYETYATCRGESNMTESERSKLKCYLGGKEIHPYWSIRPLKIEQLHRDPPVLQFYDFIGNQAIESINKSAYESFARSGTVADTGNHSEYSTARTSMSTWIFDDESYDDPPPPKELMSLNRRIELCTGFHVLKLGSSQALQVVNYGSLGGHYDFHDDALLSHLLTKDDGDRIATFFMFLNDVPMGGYTAFPGLQIFARPVKGSAILWFSLFRNGLPDDRHTHGGCPVILGSKRAANKWIMQYENMFRYKCSLDPDQ